MKEIHTRVDILFNILYHNFILKKKTATMCTLLCNTSLVQRRFGEDVFALVTNTPLMSFLK